jgi:hypothetical protein
MTAPLRIALFAGALVALLGASYALGDAVDPDVGDDPRSTHAAGGHGGAAARGGSAPARIVVGGRSFEPGVGETLSFRVVDGAGRTVEDFDVEHERAMHVIAVRHDLTGYQHVHPRQTDDGGWEVDVTFPDPGPHRVFADFSSGGEAHTLGADVEVAGRYEPDELPAPELTATTADGYEVALERDGRERRFTVSRGGVPVDDIEPYLGARGHLVALSEGELSFEHVHPKDAATEGRAISFDVALTEPGRYRLFLQFKHDGEVHTAAFTETVTAGGDKAGGNEHGADGHGH